MKWSIGVAAFSVLSLLSVPMGGGLRDWAMFTSGLACGAQFILLLRSVLKYRDGGNNKWNR